MMYMKEDKVWKGELFDTYRIHGECTEEATR